jgi:hypothetical protein
LVYYALGILGVARTVETVKLVFNIIDALAVSATICVVWYTARALGLHCRAIAFGLIIGFSGFAIIKWIPYYPVLLDGLGLLIGALMISFHLLQAPWLLLLTVAVSFFTWPSATYMGLLMLALSRRQALPSADVPSRGKYDLARLSLAILGAAAFVIGLAIMPKHVPEPADDVYPIDPDWYVVSLVAIGVLMGSAFYFLLPSPFVDALRRTARSVSLGYALLGLAVVYALPALMVLMVDTVQYGASSTAKVIIRVSLTMGIVLPLKSVVAHVSFFGLIGSFMLLYWPSVARQAHLWGAGVTLALLLMLLQGMDSESRHLIHYLPVIVLLAIGVMSRAGWSEAMTWKTFLFVGIAGLASSRVWHGFHGAPFAASPKDPRDHGFYMAHGPFMSPADYVIFALAGIATTATLWLIVRSFRSRSVDWKRAS